jgi:hypothetical protein
MLAIVENMDENVCRKNFGHCRKTSLGNELATVGTVVRKDSAIDGTIDGKEFGHCWKRLSEIDLTVVGND